MEEGHVGAQLPDFVTLFADEVTKLEEALKLVTAAVSAGIFNDLGSGSNVDVTIITREGVKTLRGFVKPNERAQKERRYVFSRGTTAWKTESVRNLVVSEEIRETGVAMDTT